MALSIPFHLVRGTRTFHAITRRRATRLYHRTGLGSQARNVPSAVAAAPPPPQFVQDILESPLGTLDQVINNWKDIGDALRECYRHEKSGYLSFQLLDRIQNELHYSSSSNDDSYSNSNSNKHPMDFYSLLYSAIYQWRNEYKKAPNKECLIQPSDLFHRLLDWQRKDNGVLGAGGVLVPIDTPIYNMILEAAANNVMDIEEGPLFAEQLLEWMIQESQNENSAMSTYSPPLQPTTVSVALVMKAWAATLDDEPVHDTTAATQVCDRLESWLNRLHDMHEQGWPNTRPNAVVYNTYLHALAEAGLADRAEQVLQSLLRGERGVDPDPVSFSTLLLAYSRQQTPGAMHRAETLLSQMQELYQSGGMESAKPNLISFTTVINGHAKLGNIEAAESLLYKLEQLYQETLDSDWEPDITIYNTIMMACSRAGNPERANAWLQRILDESTLSLVPNDRSFHAVLTGWAKIGDPDQAEALLHQMHETYAAHNLETVKPTVTTYNIVLDSWAKSQKEGAWKRAVDILHHMQELSKEVGDASIQPNARTWNTVLNCFKFCGQGNLHHTFKVVDDFELAFQNGNSTEGPNLRTWNTLLACCVHNTQDDYRVLQVWDRMKGRGIAPDIVTYNTVLSCYVRYARNNTLSRPSLNKFLSMMEKDRSVVPNENTYSALVDVWIALGQMEQAEAVLKDLCTRASKSEVTVLPSRDLFHKVLRAWSKAKKPQRVESIVLLMAELYERHGFNLLEPSVETYNLLLLAWAKSKEQRQSCERSELIFREMKARNVSPDIESFNIVLNAWANSDDPTALTKIEHLVLEMIMSGNPNLTPTEDAYNAWLDAIGRSKQKDKARRGKEVLKTMKIHNLQPTEQILHKLQKVTNEQSLNLL